mmetsp:Transcript_55129/g.102086  ORF Transcript_55129/g.102086 Transcript_55129/m.102086 type:complete len:648 (+) Transcript_55129:63-2006(+)
MPGLSSCSQAADLLPPTRRRLLADLKKLQEEPVPMAAAKPHSDEDLTLWDGMIGVEMQVTEMGKKITVPLHFLIDFPANYPHSAPNIGFSFDFDYRGGANYIMQDGRLKGKKVICLDILGNFGGIHTEWKDTVGSGWSPAYTVTTLLVQLQSVLWDAGTQMSQSERDRCYESATKFSKLNPDSVLELLTEEDVKKQRRMQQIEATLSKACSGNEELQARVLSCAKQCFQGDTEAMERFAKLIFEVHEAAAVSNDVSSEKASAQKPAPPVDTNIVCFSTGKLYTEAMLGVGVKPEKRNLGTAAELLSKEAFDGGLRQGTDKTPFDYFLPVWINRTHAAADKKWQATLASSYRQIGEKQYGKTDDDEAILEVFPRLINEMIVEMMRPDASKSAAIATFEALCNFWRTLRWLVDERKSLRAKMAKQLGDFKASEDARHKDNTPDLGVTLVTYTVMQGHEFCPTRKEFIQAYVDEQALRQVMWWKRSGTKPEPAAVFEATKVSREISMFQMLVVDLIIGDVQETLEAMEATNCKLPDRLEKMQAEWKKRQAGTKTWEDYFGNIGAEMPAFPTLSLWIHNNVDRAAGRGPRYVDGGKGDKGSGKGGGNKGKGGEKGDGKGSGKGGKTGDGKSSGKGGKKGDGKKGNGKGKGW